MNAPIEREAILPRLDGIRKNLAKLKELSELSLKDFSSGDAFDLAQHHLRLALEGVFHIASHILSRIPGGRATEYKEIARKLGEYQIVPREFAEKSLIPMAGMRNILVHFYADIDAQKLHETIRNHRGDIEEFLRHVKNVLKEPGKFGLSVN